MRSPADFPAGFHLDAVGDLFFRGEHSDAEIARMAQLCMADGAEPPPCYAQSFRHTDPAARDWLGASLSKGQCKDELAILDSLACPIAVVHGEGDRIVNLDYIRRLRIPTLWRGEVQVIPGAGHCPQHDDPAHFDRLLADFVDSLPG